MGGSWRRALVTMVLDALAAGAAVPVAYYVRFYSPLKNLKIEGFVENPSLNHYIAAAPVVAVVVVAAFVFMGTYRRTRGEQYIDEAFSVARASAMSSIVVLAMMGLYRGDPRPTGEFGVIQQTPFTYSRVTWAVWALIFLVFALILRYGVRRVERWRRARGLDVQRALVLGNGSSAQLLIQRLRMFPEYGYELLGVLVEDSYPHEEFAGVRVLGQVKDFERVAAERQVEMVFMAIPNASQDQILEVIEICELVRSDIRIVPRTLELMTTQARADAIDGIPLVQLRQGLDISARKQAVKRLFDLVAAGLALVLLSPLLLLIAIAVRLSSPGPIVHRQERVGRGGRTFVTHKFRTMREDAEAETGPVWATADDPRRTAVGRFLRRTSLDELPQLIDIVAGHMSLVGPRAERQNFVDEFASRIPRYHDRHMVRPGLTGWAQCNDLRGQTPVEDRLNYDLYYIENWSLGFDLKIILLTAFRFLRHKNAY